MEQMIQKPMLISSIEAAKILGYRSTYIHELAKRGTIRSFRAGNYLLFSPDDVYEFKQERDRMKEYSDALMTVRDVANFVGVTDDAVYTYAEENKIQHFKSANRLWFYRTDVERFANETGRGNRSVNRV